MSCRALGYSNSEQGNVQLVLQRPQGAWEFCFMFFET